MHLSAIVHRESVLVPLTSKKRDDAIAELADALHAARVLNSKQRDEANALAIKRERRGSTGFGHGVAVPHARLAWESEPIAAFGLAPGGIDFKALDREPVRAVFFLVTPEGNPDRHVAAMEAIFGAVGNEQFRRFLQSVSTPPEFLDLLQDLEAGSLRGS